MGSLLLHHHHQQLQMNPFAFSICRAAAATKLSFIKCCCISTTSTNSKLITKRVCAADEIKQQWLNSLTCTPPILPTNNNQQDSNWVIGIDPDVSGALAVLKTTEEGFASSAQVYDSPNVKMLVGKRIRRRMDTKAMVELLRSLNIPNGTTAYIEQSLPYPGDGKLGWWSGGFNYGLWIGVLVASEISVVPVPSVRWKQEFKLSGNGKTKDDSRALACTLFPSLSSSLKRKKDHGRAEALLIAAYGKGIKLNADSLCPPHNSILRYRKTQEQDLFPKVSTVIEQQRNDSTIIVDLLINDGISIVGYSRGLFVLWNPSIRRSVGILGPVYLFYPFGFAVCSVTNEPTVVKISYPWKVEIFALSSKRWAVIQCRPLL
nr:Holliday junction resolvase MOC1, chloroplastic-like isoform X1 [Tanacetum cinerariifolium]